MWTEIINLIVGFLRDKKEEDKEVRKQVCELLKHIGKTIESAAGDIEAGEYPHGKCSELQIYSKELVTYLQGKLPDEKLKELEAQLIEASNIERDFAKRGDPDTITKLYFASAYFQAMGALHGV
jgi:hypothetical protein